jgi:hypothetical protein
VELRQGGLHQRDGVPAWCVCFACVRACATQQLAAWLACLANFDSRSQERTDFLLTDSAAAPPSLRLSWVVVWPLCLIRRADSPLQGTPKGTVALVNLFINTLVFKDSPTGLIMIHLSKPTTNLEGLGYGWTCVTHTRVEAAGALIPPPCAASVLTALVRRQPHLRICARPVGASIDAAAAAAAAPLTMHRSSKLCLTFV